jgi:HSP20 family molecular chaperone IbpA
LGACRFFKIQSATSLNKHSGTLSFFEQSQMKSMTKQTLLVAPLALAIFFTTNPEVSAADSQSQKSILTSSVDVQEDTAAYSVRVGVPETTDVNVRLAGSTLILDSGATVSGIRHEQRISLPKAQADAALGIKRTAGQLVISIPKGEPAPASGGMALPSQIPMNAGFDALRDQVLSQAANMLQQMNQEDAPAGGAVPAQDLFGSILGSIAPQLQGKTASSGFKVEDRGDAYLLTSVLPEEQARNVSVNVDNERAVTITSKHEKQSAAGGATAFSSGSSTQSMTLPGPVRGEELKMEYKNGRLEIVLPKK